MKQNRFKQVLVDGKVAVGHMVVEFGTRGVARMLEAAGVDFVLVDTEHSGFSFADIANMMAWFKATTVAPFVRIPQIQYHFIARTLDAGALGIMVPNVKSGTEARAVVEAAKYAPLGRRGVSIGGANTDYIRVNPKEFMAYANENTTIICQIESQEGLDNLTEIATTPGVDVLWVGHFDLTQSLGIPAQFQHPKFLDALKSIVETARKHDLAAGIQPYGLAQAQEWMGMGFNVISYGGDLAVYVEAVTQAVVSVRKLARVDPSETLE
jgi:2-dehydro-3-deoxyglucarate aldolase/4-hydroxy-2-oxoheptanedioate aldolase